MKQGGNAVDAAVAAAFTLAVTYPEAGNIGGGGFMTLYFKGRPYFLDYRDRAPAAATRDMYLDDKADVIPGLSVVGHLSVGVPGSVMGLWEAHQRFGQLAWRRLMGPALRYAREGFTVTKHLVDRRDVMLNDFGRTNFTAYFGAMKTGEVFCQPQLEATLGRIAAQGPKGFYEGITADFLVAEIAKNRGLITKEDLKAYRAVWREPLQANWRGYRIVTAPPPSSGGIGLVQHLKMKEALQRAFENVPLNSAQYIHLLAEIAKRVFADRAEYVGDPDFHEIPVARLIDDTYLGRRAKEVDVSMASPTEDVRPGLPESDETTHFSIVDKWGNAVSNTFTLNAKFGSGVVVENAGFLLNNGMDDFSSKPGVANRFGLIGRDANAIAPGRRMVSSMAPTILTKDGQVALIIGTPGGSRIFTTMFQVINDLFHFRLTLTQSVAEMRVHHQLFPLNTIWYEPYAPIRGALAEELRERGYDVLERYTNGDMQVVHIVDGVPAAASDPRGRGVSGIVRDEERLVSASYEKSRST
jgi:gamma-glutamyltranspeptidase/glutathione hydrolase